MADEVVDDRGAVERRAVVERDARAGLDRPDRVVGVRLDRLGEVRLDRAVGRRRASAGRRPSGSTVWPEIAQQRLGRLHGLPRVGLDAHDELAAGLGLEGVAAGRVRAAGRSRSGAAACGRAGAAPLSSLPHAAANSPSARAPLSMIIPVRRVLRPDRCNAFPPVSEPPGLASCDLAHAQPVHRVERSEPTGRAVTRGTTGERNL